VHAQVGGARQRPTRAPRLPGGSETPRFAAQVAAPAARERKGPRTPAGARGDAGALHAAAAAWAGRRVAWWKPRSAAEARHLQAPPPPVSPDTDDFSAGRGLRGRCGRRTRYTRR